MSARVFVTDLRDEGSEQTGAKDAGGCNAFGLVGAEMEVEVGAFSLQV